MTTNLPQASADLTAVAGRPAEVTIRVASRPRPFNGVVVKLALQGFVA